MTAPTDEISDEGLAQFCTQARRYSTPSFADWCDHVATSLRAARARVGAAEARLRESYVCIHGTEHLLCIECDQDEYIAEVRVERLREALEGLSHAICRVGEWDSDARVGSALSVAFTALSALFYEECRAHKALLKALEGRARIAELEAENERLLAAARMLRKHLLNIADGSGMFEEEVKALRETAWLDAVHALDNPKPDRCA